MLRIDDEEIDELDAREWNDLLLGSEVCDAFQTYEWAVVLRNSMSVCPHFLYVKNKGQKIGGAMFTRKKMFGVFDCYEIIGGPLYVKGNREVVAKNILKALSKKKNRSGYVLFIPYPVINSSFKRVFEIEGYHSYPFCTIIIDLGRPLKDVWQALNKRARWGVRKAERLGLTTKVANNWSEWERYYHLHVLHSKKKQYPSEPVEFFGEMFKLHHKNMARLFLAEYGKRIVAGSLFLVYRQNMIFLQNASERSFLRYNPNNLLQWRSIEWAKENGVTTYDMNGLPLEDVPYLRGVYNYKKQWNGHVQFYYYYLNRKLLYRAIHLARTNSLAWKLFLHARNLKVI